MSSWKKNNPEFEELAAMQAGFELRPVMGGGMEAGSGAVDGGRVCLRQLLPHVWAAASAGSCLTDRDDVAARPWWR